MTLAIKRIIDEGEIRLAVRPLFRILWHVRSTCQPGRARTCAVNAFDYSLAGPVSFTHASRTRARRIFLR
jgi:hypothetical protein